mgnify:CR=1 FL=1
MINEHMMDLGSRRSTIRELFEYGNSRAAIVGRENIFDFSIGNPNVPAPEAVRQAIYAEAAGDPVALHGYTSAQVPQTCEAHWRTASTSVSARTTPATACT